MIMGLTHQSAEDKEIIGQVLGSVFGRDDARPIDECACYNEDGTFNVSKFEAYLDRDSDESSANMSVVYLLQLLTEAKAKAAMDLRVAEEKLPPPKKTRVRRVKTFSDPSSGRGVVVPMTAKHSLWWMLYIQDPNVDCPQWNKVFRKQFRLPYQSFLDLLAMIKDGMHCDFIERWREDRPDKKFRKIKASPIELLLLGIGTWVADGHLMIWRTNQPLSQGLCLQRWKSSGIVNLRSSGLQGFQYASEVLTRLTSHHLRRSRTA